MIQRRRFPAAIAALSAGFAIVAALPSGSTQARWSDSTTLEQPLLTTVSDAEPVSPPDISIDDHDGSSNPDAPDNSPGFSVTPDTDVVVDGLTVRRGTVVRGTGMPNLPNHVDIDVWLTPAAGVSTCQAFEDSLESRIIPDGAVRLGDTIQHSHLNGTNSFSFLNANPLIAADTTRSICPIVTITKGSTEDYAGSSFELIFRYTFTSPTSGKSVSGEITTLYAIDTAGTSASTAPVSDSTEAVSTTGTVTATATDKDPRSGAEDSESLDHSPGTENSSREPGQAEENDASADGAELDHQALDVEPAELGEVAP